ncbi:ATP-dependent RNA helicase A [Pyrenophora tritici-repentis]|uniref:RNA helicase n=2 Tax=Pyrenophora tritici-repentis TaxID=45151 RepID=A0A2W1EMH8_9PLEO|nr:ATP-dependent RNA helicase A [Pyrenophora tritici-repentis Pt-1C-BFP]KAA8618626.1 ATP-dependent RNA helicase A [Pyrenophora tritici-repentis]EDU48477.1 ATP-dependent RNA helicase A [Pyrenophora tritici-repentis Pt-1C-BFP]KAI0573951.1 ATP-dependent RNA helicase A [Pyrenophora tritici-repentis]KAI0577917.1 ATP-dependent RNA helicase A [Pyrenophora tritici-repentis]KAI0607544.1 ATP-dependent RNA helicase A [Pyrenophora tritici-repentis]
MPKNAHPPRGKPAKKTVPPEEDTSFIVFGDGKPKKKKGESSGGDGTQSDSKGKGKTAPGQSEDGPKKPDTRTLIAGASWTGKLPVNLLSEHFQKQQWSKPDYRIRKDGDRHFAYAVVLSKMNQKTRETTTLPPIKIPPELEEQAHQPTAVEARNFAAAYTLFRVASAKNLHMMLPPTYKDLWKGQFTELKKRDEQEGKGWMYEADPFFGFAEREKARESAAKAREKRQKQQEEAQKAHNQQPGAAMPSASTGAAPRNLMKGWERVPKIELGKKTRKEAERLIRRDAVWNPNGVEIDAATKLKLVDEITDLGFRRSHVEEAAEICKDREEIIEWLLIHVPEDDLPSWSLPEGYVAGVSMASSNLKREGAVKRLAAAGYALDLCEEAYDSQGGDERKAAALLQARLLRPDDEDNIITQDLVDLSIVDTDPEDDPWEVEMSSLEAIYDRLFTRPAPELCRIELDVKQQGKRLILQVRKPFGPYPAVVPIITFEAAIPAYIRLSIIRQALLHAESNFIGMPMIYDIVDWIQTNAGDIFQNPGRLTDVSAGLAAADHSSEPQSQKRRAKGGRARRPIDWTPATPPSQRILTEWQAKQGSAAQQKMMAARQSLPAWRLREEIVHTVNNCKVTIISGETGSGKSTQSVQFVLDDLIQRQLGAVANIICTQPRRISALGLADRVADERCSQVGDEIGYTIRGESKQKPGVTKITFVTTGVLLRRLQTSGGNADDVVAALADVSHVVVDEVHERSLDTDFLLVLLRQILRTRKDLKVILMSATLDAAVFEAYFKEVGPVGRVEIEGRTHPVTDYYIDDILHFTGFKGYGMGEDDATDEKSFSANLRSIGFGINYDLIAETVRYIDRQLGEKDGGILIFLPGTMEIDRTLQALSHFVNLHALPLHASLMPVEQKRVFPPAPHGKRKVIACTNVAETSITIEDIVAVIDTGRVKETSYDPQNNMVRLAETWASRAACKQRRGRAGRVRAGDCYKMYTRNAEAKMMERPDPEIRRVPLEQMCLSIKSMGVQDVSGFLASALAPPESTAVEGAIRLLSQMGAITDNELTALGRHMSMIPADLRLGKLLVYGATFGCLDAALTIASVLTARSPFLTPRERDQETRNEFDRLRASFSNNQGDLLVDLRAYEQWAAQRSKGASTRDLRFWCQENRLSPNTLFDIASNRTQYLSSLKEISFIPTHYSSANPATHSTYNKHNANDALLRALIAGAFNPQIARIQLPDKKFAAGIAGAVELDPSAREIKYFNQDNGRVFVHPSSTLFSSQTFPHNASFVAYFNKMATSKVFVRDITPFNAFSLLLFAGRIQVDTLGRGLVVDEWIRLRGWARIGVLVSRLRGMLDSVLEGMVKEPGKGVGKREGEVVDVVRWLVERDGLDA